MKRLSRAFIIGMGEVGRRLADALGRAGVIVVPVIRGSGWQRALSEEEGVRVVCVREDDLAGVLERLRDVPRQSVVCVQNGWIRPLLGDAEIGRALIWFTSKGEFFRELRPSPFAGPYAIEIAAALKDGGLDAVAVSGAELASLEADKMGFNCVVGLPLAVHNLSLGEYLSTCHDEARSVFTEAVETCARALGARPDPGWWAAFLDSVQPLSWVRTQSAKALDYRNGAVVRIARDLGLRAPANEELLDRLSPRR
jgi:hypothetical protein